MRFFSVSDPFEGVIPFPIPCSQITAAQITWQVGNGVQSLNLTVSKGFTSMLAWQKMGLCNPLPARIK
jgi:hypothetical protein